MTTKADMHL